eukprot:jgi/Mesen1/6178/ME000032S05466
MPIRLPSFSGHRTKPEKLTFSERQRQRKANSIPEEEEEALTPGSLPLFRSHRSKPDKLTFSERLRQRKAGDLEDDGQHLIGHRVKDTITFSERQRQRKRNKSDDVVDEQIALDSFDGSFPTPGVGEYSSTVLQLENVLEPDMGNQTEYAGEELRGKVEKEEEELDIIPVESSGFKIKLKLGPSAKRLLSGAFAGGISRTAVAPLETIRTHLMVGNSGKKGVKEVFDWIMKEEGWTGLFRGNGINVLRVAPSKAIELFAFDTVKKALSPKDGSKPKFPISPIAGSSAGIASCICTYPLELVKTRLTVQPGEYKSVVHAFYRIATEEGFLELYRGLVPSVIGVIPYAGANYYAYDSLRTLYKKTTKKERISNLVTLLIGSTAGAIASTATFPLEVARKQMQVGALQGRVVYKGTLHALSSILKEQGIGGLYRGLGPSCIKLMPAAGISFMCYEALKQILIEEERKEERKAKQQ